MGIWGLHNSCQLSTQKQVKIYIAQISCLSTFFGKVQVVLLVLTLVTCTSTSCCVHPVIFSGAAETTPSTSTILSRYKLSHRNTYTVYKTKKVTKETSLIFCHTYLREINYGDLPITFSLGCMLCMVRWPYFRGKLIG